MSSLLASFAAASPIVGSLTPAAAVSRNDEAARLFARASITCAVVNSSSATVNCRSGPGFNYGVTYVATPGDFYIFSCYKENTASCYENNW
jgi:uncharacterized protein YraI